MPQRRSPFESPSARFITRRQITRYVRNGLILASALVAFADTIGEPLLRWEYRYRGKYSEPHITSATYVGIRGSSDAISDRDRYPVVLFERPEPPLWRQGVDNLLSLIP